MKTPLQTRLHQDLENKAHFEEAKTHALTYCDEIFDRAVYPSDEALANLSQLDQSLPEDGCDPSKIIEQLNRLGSPATVASLGARYFGLVVGSALPATLSTKWLSDVWDQNSGLYKMSPISAKLEAISEKWLTDIFGLPQGTCAGFVSGTSTAILCGLAAGRYRLYQNMGVDINRVGMKNAPDLEIIASEQAHGTVVKALAVLGMGLDNVTWVPSDDQGRIRDDLVPDLSDRSLLILQAGNVNSGAYDDFDSLCARARKAGAWVHIDGAFGMWAKVCPEFDMHTKAIELANSWSVDGHKTLNTPYDNGIVLCQDKEALVSALQLSGAYVEYSTERDGMHYTQEMSRRARANEIWAAFNYLGRSGIQSMVLNFHHRSLQFAKELAAAGFTIHNDVVFNQVLVSCETDAITQATIHNIQRSGECWVGGSTWHDRAVIRVSVCSWATDAADVSRSVQAFIAARDKAQSEAA